eukprot:CAMPEP_0176110070 /NCGR_PEP_ID=MMETSP0120_2-20121206/55267_1 /TAXON_ID=160619 /ORGANISM="Kryptoperidinium foliaceum, Strain CCMP 1326" /LENGTH=353 /DNA_ID=CAMNT_0017444267 /DNA_START=23 /DNA_END=1084 /DNA_ORIENTATION=-
MISPSFPQLLCSLEARHEELLNEIAKLTQENQQLRDQAHDAVSALQVLEAQLSAVVDRRDIVVCSGDSYQGDEISRHRADPPSPGSLSPCSSVTVRPLRMRSRRRSRASSCSRASPKRIGALRRLPAPPTGVAAASPSPRSLDSYLGFRATLPGAAKTLPALPVGLASSAPTSGMSSPSAGAAVDWREELPGHISEDVCKACLEMSRRVAVAGLDEKRPHHGFTMVIGDEDQLASCGSSSFNPFLGHDIRILNADGELDDENFDVVRRNAFWADGAILVNGTTGRIVASGWFVNDLRKGGTKGGARTRSARAVAQQGGGCFVIKCSEDSQGQLDLFIGDQKRQYSRSSSPSVL